MLLVYCHDERHGWYMEPTAHAAQACNQPADDEQVRFLAPQSRFLMPELLLMLLQLAWLHRRIDCFVEPAAHSTSCRARVRAVRIQII